MLANSRLKKQKNQIIGGIMAKTERVIHELIGDDKKDYSILESDSGEERDRKIRAYAESYRSRYEEEGNKIPAWKKKYITVPAQPAQVKTHETFYHEGIPFKVKLPEPIEISPATPEQRKEVFEYTGVTSGKDYADKQIKSIITQYSSLYNRNYNTQPSPPRPKKTFKEKFSENISSKGVVTKI